jgi:predicted RNA methylase
LDYTHFSERVASAGNNRAATVRERFDEEVAMILDALLGTCLFAAAVALLSVPFMPRNNDR